MKTFSVTLAKEQIVLGVQNVIKAVSQKNALPILHGIYLKAENDQLTFIASDTKITIKCSVPAKVEVTGATVVPAKIFSEFVKKLPDMDITLVVKNEEMVINYFMSSVNLKTMSADEFPQLKAPEGEPLQIPASVLKQMLRQTSFAIADERMGEKRPVFTGVLFEMDGGYFNMVATDTHRLAYKYESIGISDSRSVIVPGYAVAEVLRLMRDEDETVETIIADGSVGFKFGNVTVSSQLIAGEFPKYKAVIPKASGTKVRLATKTFADALERAALLTKGESNVVKFKVEVANKRLMLCADGERGKVSESLTPNDMSGTDVEVAFNAKFMADALKVADTEEITIEFGGPSSPGVVHPYGDDTYLYLALPVRVA